MYCQAQFITKEEAQQIETDLKEDNFIENKYFYQYEETERGKFHTGKLNESQQQEFQEFMKIIKIYSSGNRTILDAPP